MGLKRPPFPGERNDNSAAAYKSVVAGNVHWPTAAQSRIRPTSGQVRTGIWICEDIRNMQLRKYTELRNNILRLGRDFGLEFFLPRCCAAQRVGFRHSEFGFAASGGFSPYKLTRPLCGRFKGNGLCSNKKNFAIARSISATLPVAKASALPYRDRRRYGALNRLCHDIPAGASSGNDSTRPCDFGH